jgi:uncharacterized membrane protein YheB (UPF0754 family)
MKDQIITYINYGVWILFGSGIVFEISPIKINPISSLLSWIGSKLNKDLKKDIYQIQTDMNTIRLDLQDHKVESLRREILDFSDDLMHGMKKTKENFNYIIALHDKYDRFIETNGLENGQVDLAFDYISNKYKEYQENNSFL